MICWSKRNPVGRSSYLRTTPLSVAEKKVTDVDNYESDPSHVLQISSHRYWCGKLAVMFSLSGLNIIGSRLEPFRARCSFTLCQSMEYGSSNRDVIMGGENLSTRTCDPLEVWSVLSPVNCIRISLMVLSSICYKFYKPTQGQDKELFSLL